MPIQEKRGGILKRDTAGTMARVKEIRAPEKGTEAWGEELPERPGGNDQNGGGRNVDLKFFVATQEVTAKEVGLGCRVIMLDKSRLQFCMAYSGTTVASIAAQVHERGQNTDENNKFSHAGTYGQTEYSEDLKQFS